MKTDACLGYATMSYKSSELDFESYDANPSLLFRLVDQESKIRSGSKKELAQRAKADYCSCGGLALSWFRPLGSS